MPAALDISRSLALLERARRVIPGASQTVSKSPAQWAQGAAPVFVARGQGPFLWDVDGNRYYDMVLALGPAMLGYAHPAVNHAITEALADGITFTLPHPLEVEVAERIARHVPGAEMVRFMKSGSDATSAAIRVARAVTGREHVLAGGYHGWHDWFIGSTPRDAGVPRAVRDLTHPFAPNDLASLDAAAQAADGAGNVAAIILEPAGLHEPERGYLEAVRERADRWGAVLVFDEIITGFRLAMGGAQERYGVTADLVCFGKALANGMPLSAVAGPERLMRTFESPTFVSGTHGGETLSLAACRATLDVLESEPVHEGLWCKGERLMAIINESAGRHGVADVLRATGAAPRFIVTVDEPRPEGGLAAYTLLQQELVLRGVLFSGSNFMCHALDDEQVEEVGAAYDEAIAVLAGVWPDGLEVALQGPPVPEVFRRP